VLVALNSEEDRAAAYEVAKQLRGRDIPTEVFYAPQKFGKQIRYAEKKGIPYVLFVGEAGYELKDIRSGEQTQIELATWTPSAQELAVQIVKS
jgi:histidyl-tRNA synthetase